MTRLIVPAANPYRLTDDAVARAEAYLALVAKASGLPPLSADPDRTTLAARYADSAATPHHAPARGPEEAGTTQRRVQALAGGDVLR